MQQRSIITWKDAAKLAVGIAVGVSFSIGIIRCTGQESNNKIEHNSARVESFKRRMKKLVVSGIVTDSHYTFGNDSIGIYEKDGKYGFYHVGTEDIIIPAEYEKAWRFSEGLAGVIKNDLLGFINLKGETVIEFNYAYKKSRLYDFIFERGYCAVPNMNGLCGVIDNTGNWVIQPQYEFITMKPDYIIGSLKKDFKKQLDYSGNIINHYVIDEVYELKFTQYVVSGEDSDQYLEKDIPTGFYKYWVNSYFGLMDDTGKFLTMPIYDNIEVISKDLFKATLQGADEIILLDGKGNVIK